MRIIRFELITSRLKGEYSTYWVIFPSIPVGIYSYGYAVMHKNILLFCLYSYIYILTFFYK